MIDIRRADLRSLAMVVLTALVIFRLGIVAIHDPMLAWPDNNDFRRIQGWFGLISPKGSILQPIRHFDRGEPDPENRYVSAIVPVVAIANVLSGPSSFDLKIVGALQVTIFLAALGFVLWRIRDSLAAPVVTTAAFIVADPALSLYVNSLYCEWLVAVGWFASTFLLAHMARSLRQSWLLTVATSFSLVLVGTGKKQYLLLPLLLVGITLLSPLLRRKHHWPHIGALIVAALLPMIIYSGRIGLDDGYMRMAQHSNAVNTCLGFLLPLMDEPAKGLEVLSLPIAFDTIVGRGWNDLALERFPEVNRIPTVGFLKLLRAEPTLAVKATITAFPNLRPAVLTFGQIEGVNRGRVTTPDFSIFFSPLEALDRLPYWLFMFFHMVGIVAVMLACLRILKALRRVESPIDGTGTAWAVVMLGATWGYAYYSSMFGDGLFEFQKHAFLCGVCLLSVLTLAAFEFFRQVFGSEGSRRLLLWASGALRKVSPDDASTL
jgi:hypothetical protein